MNSSQKFDICIPVILRHEGGYANYKNDPGGATNFGISLRFLKGLKDVDDDGFLHADINHDGKVDIEDIIAMTKEVACDFYEHYFWNKYYDSIENNGLVLHIFDHAVNAGPKIAHKLIQRIVGVTDDGIIGNKTLNAIEGSKGKDLTTLYSMARIEFYQKLVINNPDVNKFLNGWISRVYSTKF